MARTTHKNKTVLAPEQWWPQECNPGCRTRAKRLGHSATQPKQTSAPTAAYRFGGRAKNHKGVLGKQNLKLFLAAPPPLAEYEHICALNQPHSRMRVHTHSRHKLTTQTQLYSKKNQKQGVNPIHNLPNTTKLKQSSTTTAKHRQTARPSAQTNMSTQTKTLRRSKKNKSDSNNKNQTTKNLEAQTQP